MAPNAGIEPAASTLTVLLPHQEGPLGTIKVVMKRDSTLALFYHVLFEKYVEWQRRTCATQQDLTSRTEVH